MAMKARYFDRKTKVDVLVVDGHKVRQRKLRMEPESLHDEKTGERFVLKGKPLILEGRGRTRQVFVASAQTCTTLDFPTEKNAVEIAGQKYALTTMELGTLLESNDLYALHNSVKETNWLVVILASLGGIGLGYILSMAFDAFMAGKAAAPVGV